MSLKAKAIQLVINGRDKTGRAVKGVLGGLGKLKKSVLNLKTVFAGLVIGGSGGLLAKSFLNAARETENYQVRLKVLLGSQKEGNRLFKEMSEYASRVPFEYNEIMGAATQLSGIMKGGVDEITQWMPLIGDLAAASGLGIRKTTEQVSRMLSAGAATADLFRERGVLSMLGFQAGVSYSAEETRKQLMAEWTKAGSQFAGTTGEMAKTWDGLMSMLSDAWFNFRQMVMDSGVFDAMKASVQGVLDKIKELKESGKLADLAKGFGEKIMSGFTAGLKALPGIIRGAIKAAEMLVLAVSGFKQIKAVFTIFFKQVQIWSLEFVNQLRLVVIRLLESMPGTKGQAKQRTAGLYQDIGETFERIDKEGGLAAQLEQAKVNLGKLQIKQDQTEESFKNMAETAGNAVKEMTDGALKGMADGHEAIAAASKKATDSQVKDIDRMIEKYNELNAVKLSGVGSFSTTKFSGIEDLDRMLEDAEDR